MLLTASTDALVAALLDPVRGAVARALAGSALALGAPDEAIVEAPGERRPTRTAHAASPSSATHDSLHMHPYPTSSTSSAGVPLDTRPADVGPVPRASGADEAAPADRPPRPASLAATRPGPAAPRPGATTTSIALPPLVVVDADHASAPSLAHPGAPRDLPRPAAAMRSADMSAYPTRTAAVAQASLLAPASAAADHADPATVPAVRPSPQVRPVDPTRGAPCSNEPVHVQPVAVAIAGTPLDAAKITAPRTAFDAAAIVGTPDTPLVAPASSPVATATAATPAVPDAPASSSPAHRSRAASSAPLHVAPNNPPPDVAPIAAVTPPPSSPGVPVHPRTAGPGPARHEPPPLRPADAAVADQVSRAMSPVFVDAGALTDAALHTPDEPRVANHFAVHVQLGGTVDPDALGIALVDMLREAARRHGLEV